MGRLPSRRGRAMWLLVLPLFWVGCSDPAGVPFRERGSGSAADPHREAAATEGTGSSDVPFRDPQSLPAGTLLTVRLKNPVSSENPGSSGTFTAEVDEPVVVEGTILVPRGAHAAGRIESSRSSTVQRNHGYVRLTLDLVDLAGQNLPIRTSSLFARGNTGEPHAGETFRVVSLEQGRRLTFRLTEPVYVASRTSIPPR